MLRYCLCRFFVIIFLSFFLFSCSSFHGCNNHGLVYSLPIACDSVVTVGGFAYIISCESKEKKCAELIIINVSNPIKPVVVGSLSVRNARCLAVVGNFAYVTCWQNGLKIIDVSRPNAPILVGSLKIHGSDIVVVGDFAYINDRWRIDNKRSGGSLKIINISNPVKPVLVGSLTMPFIFPGRLTVVGKFAYVVDGRRERGGAGLKIVDISNPAKPILAGSLQTCLASCLDVVVVGEFAYIVDTDNSEKGALKIINISNPVKPAVVGSLTLHAPNRITVVGNFAYVFDGFKELKVVNISNKAKPVLADILQTTSHAFDMSIFGNFVYVVDEHSLDCFQVIAKNNGI